jgi:two-component system sensor histidine kinase ChvG
LQYFWIAPQGWGTFTALREQNRKLVDDRRIRGEWHDSTAGYVVEFTLPRALLHKRFGIVAVDGADPDQWAGSMAPDGTPGRLIQTDPLLTERLDRFAGDNLQLALVDKDQWLLAASGAPVIDIKPGYRQERAPGAWLIEAFYRLATPDVPDDERYTPVQHGSNGRAEVTRAVNGKASSTWYVTDEENNLGVVSAAAPLWLDDRIVGAVVAEQSSAGILSLTNTALVRVAGISFATMAVMFFVLIGYAGWLSTRIVRLGRDVSRAMDADGGEIRELPPQTSADEVGDLGRSFDDLLGRVRGYTDYLQTLASKLSHELRTPLAVVSSSLDNLEHEELPPQAREYLQRAQGGSKRLNHILVALSQASRVEQAINSAELESVDLTQLLGKVVAGYRSVAAAHNIECELPDAPVMITGNAELLAQGLDKLMDNARDFCPADGTIRFGLRADGGAAFISVANDGATLPDAFVDKLFESMVSKRSEKGEQVHMGLGLTIVRLVAEFHGGTVSADNRADGSGVEFVMTIPTAA